MLTATLDWVTPNLITLESVKSCSLFLEMAILSRDFGIKICLVIADAEEKQVQIHSKGTFQNLHFQAILPPANNITEILPVFHCYFNEILLCTHFSQMK